MSPSYFNQNLTIMYQQSVDIFVNYLLRFSNDSRNFFNFFNVIKITRVLYDYNYHYHHHTQKDHEYILNEIKLVVN